ncbi:MAG: LAGLIDADG family homing endonuclease [Candidatus Hadarchaeum sp.]|uniref:LAGLIDADG family homing endonuclease n=1 Tax=Candidatus Hadarchaeum sp. TaxID=2883567 RepID=UPI003D14218D
MGFIESEGVFTINTIKIRKKTKKGQKNYQYHNPAFYLVSRDRSALEIVKQILGMGKINRHGVIFHLNIRRKDECIALVNFLEGRLKSAFRAEQFEKWRQLVLEWKLRAWGEGETTAAPPSSQAF